MCVLLQVGLNRFDLFHAHMFLRGGRLGLLFHCAEYPGECSHFPVNLGYCQRCTTLHYSEHVMDWRNIIFYAVRPSDLEASC